MSDDRKKKIKNVVLQVALFYRIKDWYYHLGFNVLAVIFYVSDKSAIVL